MIAPPITWPKKRVAESDYRGADWTDHLDDGETITAHDFTISGDNALVLASKASNGTESIGRFTGGTGGSTATVVSQITTSAGRILEAVFKFPVE